MDLKTEYNNINEYKKEVQGPVSESPISEGPRPEVKLTGAASAVEPSVGETSAGETSAGEVSNGKASAGETSAGETSAGEASVGETSVGKASIGEVSAAEASAGAPAKRNLVSLFTAAEMLGISEATVRNWVKHGYLNAELHAGKDAFYLKDIQRLKEKILDGSLDRLNKRANKKNARKSFIPVEYLGNRKSSKQVTAVISFIRENEIGLNTAMFLLSVNFLRAQGIILSSKSEEIFSFREEFYKNKNFIYELADWHAAISYSHNEKHDELICCEIPAQEDILGLLYQSLLMEGEKVKRGAYYTPQVIVNKIASEVEGQGLKVMDPCCGTGQFLLSLSAKTPPQNLYGIDTDRLAVRIARLNLMAKFSDIDFNPNIFHGNSLTGFEDSLLFPVTTDLPNTFDLVTTNPPWGLQIKDRVMEHLQLLYPDIRSNESFSYMLRKGLDFLKDGGRLSFLLPESVLNVKLHADIRRYILENTQIVKIEYLDKLFRNVFTGAIKIDIIKRRNKDGQIEIVKDGASHLVPQRTLLENRDCIFDIEISPRDKQILSKVYGQKHATLKNNAEWALGIVTGDNKRYISERKGEGFEPVIRGRDVYPYFIGPNCAFIDFLPESFQQVAPLFKYWTKEKLVYRFISKQLVFALDTKQRLTLNSANILIPAEGFYPVKVILALFNSPLYQFIFQKKFSSIKVLRTHLEELPLPLWDKGVLAYIEKEVDRILGGDGDVSGLNEFIMQEFSLNPDEIKYVKQFSA